MNGQMPLVHAGNWLIVKASLFQHRSDLNPPCASSSPTPLQRLCLASGAATSAKFMPVSSLNAWASLQWLWSVVRLQGLHNLYGLSGPEMGAAYERVVGNRLLSFQHSQDGPRCAIIVQRPLGA